MLSEVEVRGVLQPVFYICVFAADCGGLFPDPRRAAQECRPDRGKPVITSGFAVTVFMQELNV